MNSLAIHTPTCIFFGTDQLKFFADAASKLGSDALAFVGLELSILQWD